MFESGVWMSVEGEVKKRMQKIFRKYFFSFSQTAERESKGRRYQRFIRFLGVEKNNTYINIKEPRHL